MAISKFYLKRDATTVSGTLVGTSATVSATTPTYIGAAGNLSESMSATISTAAHTSLTLSVPGNTTVARSGLIARWYSDPVAAQTFSSQTITVSIAVQENNLDSNYQFTWCLAVWRPSTGTLVGRIWDLVSAAAEPGTTGVTAVTLGTGGSSSSVTAQSGDVLVLEAWRASSVTAATNTRNNLVYFDGTTEGSTTSNAAYLQFTNAVLMAIDRPVADSITTTDTLTFSTSGLVGTKKFYLRAADHTVPGTFPTTSVSVSAATPSKITTTNLSESLDTTIGTGQTSVTHTTLAQTAAQTGLISRFMSRPLAAQTFASQQLDLSVAVSESNNDSDFYVTFVLAVWRPSTGAVVGRIFDRTTRTTTEAATTQAVRPVSSAGSSTSVTAADGDVLILEVWRSSQAQLSSNARDNVIYFDGTTEGSLSNTAAFLSFANTVFFKRQDEQRPATDVAYILPSGKDGYAHLFGETGNVLTVPDAPNLSFGAGDVDIRARLAADDWAAAGITVLVSKTSAGTTDRSYTFNLNGGLLRVLLNSAVNGAGQVAINSTTAVGFGPGEAGWVRFVRVNTTTVSAEASALGLGTSDVAFFTAPDSDTMPTSWTQLGNIIVDGYTGTLTTSTADIGIGNYYNSSLSTFRGKVFRAVILSEINGSAVLDVDLDAVSSPSASSFTATTGQTVTVTRATSGRALELVQPLGRAVSSNRSLSDSVTASDALARFLTASGSATDTITVVEDLDATGSSGNVSHEAELAESITASDTVARQLTTAAAATDTLTSSDTFTSPGSLSRSVAGSVTVADDVARAAGTLREIIGSLTVTDALVGPGSLARPLSDTVTVSDIVDASTSANVSAQVSDSVTAADVVAGGVSMSRLAADVVTLSDAVTVAVTASVGAVDSVSVADVVARQVAAATGLTDLVSLGDDLARAAALVAAAADTLIFGSAVAVQAGVSSPVVDSVTVADLVDWSAPTTAGAMVPAVSAGPLMQAVTAAAATTSGATQAEASQSAGSGTSSSITPASGASATMTGA